MIGYSVRGTVDDAELSRLHAVAFSRPYELQPWTRRLSAHSLSWVSAHDTDDGLVGFVNIAWDGGAHAFLLDCVVHPDVRRSGVGSALVMQASHEARRAGCTWLHVDFERHLSRFYLETCGFRPTAAGLLRLTPATR
jgi:GNAT superfamily N-acetyltransferase